ncbi:Uncharacterized protein TCM_029960 [Theobroma cacao]|uniref:Uncharacterized protein n=1 Tax=Theobroma cacao TaxID=3641 RepID=A0A061GMN7_THECC|nr:Uncharacterized protein TCM_029960 [Theobroma cacao]
MELSESCESHNSPNASKLKTRFPTKDLCFLLSLQSPGLCGSERKKNGRCKKGNDQQWEFFTKDCWTSDPKEGSSESGNIGGDCPFFCFYIFSKQSQGSCCCKLVLALHLCPKQGKKERHEILMILEERVGGVVACPRKDVSCLVFG